MEPNKSLLKKTLRFVTKNQALWDQREYRCSTNPDNDVARNSCGTTMCFAGHAVALDGAEFFPLGQGVNSFVKAKPEDYADDIEIICPDKKNGEFGKRGYRAVSIRRRARRILKLNEEDTDTLFDGDNNLEDLKELVDYFCSPNFIPDALNSESYE